MIVRSIDPRTGELVKEFTSSPLSEVRASLERGRNSQKVWFEDWEKGDRISAMRELQTVLSSMKGEIVETIQGETGFPEKDIHGTFGGVIKGFDHYIHEYQGIDDYDFPLDPSAWKDTNATINLVPHGTISHIGIWNYPFWQTMISVIPALLTGNSIVFKPSEWTTMTGMVIKKAIDAAGLPKDVFQVLIGGGDLGKEMVRAPFDALVFTGGIQTGLDIMHNSGIKPMILELSGNDPCIICADADPSTVARGVATGTFSHGGQVCIRIKRVYVVESIADQFLDNLLEITRGIDVREQIGPLIREEARGRVDAKVKEAIHQGCDLLAGGRKIDGPGYYYEPTVLKVHHDDLEIMREETFGPVCPVRVVKDEEEAVRLANDSPYGLGATIWTRDPQKGERLARRLESGTVWINDCGRTINSGELFQGWKCSGIPSVNRRVSLFMKKRAIINHYCSEPRTNWFH